MTFFFRCQLRLFSVGGHQQLMLEDTTSGYVIEPGQKKKAEMWSTGLHLALSNRDQNTPTHFETPIKTCASTCLCFCFSACFSATPVVFSVWHDALSFRASPICNTRPRVSQFHSVSSWFILSSLLNTPASSGNPSTSRDRDPWPALIPARGEKSEERGGEEVEKGKKI